MSLNDKTVAGFLLQTVKKYIDKHISVLTTSLNNKNKTKRFKVSKGATSVATGTPFITNESLISFDRIIGNPATSIANIGVDGDYFVESGTIHFKEFNKDIVISCGVNYGTHDIAHADILGQKTTENDISVMKHEIDMLSGSGIGFEGIYYIQDVGSKVKGKIYLDKTQEGIWKCLNTTTSINNTSDFERIDATTLDDKLRNLYVIESIDIAGGTLRKFKDGRCIFEGYLMSDDSGAIYIPGIMTHFIDRPPVVLSNVYVLKNAEVNYGTVFNYDSTDITIYTLLKGVVSRSINCSVLIHGHWK